MTALQQTSERLARSLRWRCSANYWQYLVDRVMKVDTRVHWSRVVMDRTTTGYLRSLRPRELDALEISGTRYQSFGFRSYERVTFPDFDLCDPCLAHDRRYDVVILEQVLEHVERPWKAVENVYSLLKDGGTALVATPFLIKIHDAPIDCSRWSELGLKHLLAAAGFDFERITTGSWGNRACVRANFARWTPWNALFHSLENEPDFPVHVWAFARK